MVKHVEVPIKVRDFLISCTYMRSEILSVANEDLNLLGYDTMSVCKQYFRGVCCLHSRIQVIQEEKLSLEKWAYYVSNRQAGMQASGTVSVCSG